MKKINLRDKNFAHQQYSSRYGSSSLLEWDRSCTQPGPVVYTDAYLNDKITGFAGEKIAWLLEPVVIYPHTYVWIRRHWNLFREVWTHDEELMSAIPNARWVPMGGAWVGEEHWKIHEKKKLCSFIASSKNFAPGHKLRQQVRGKLPSFIDQYGAGFRPIEDKAEGLNDYRFSIVIENCVRDTYFTEKIIDCFLTGTIPIYWGTKKIEEHFDAGGIIRFETVGELEEIVGRLSEAEYIERMKPIRQNYELGMKMMICDEWIIK